VEHKRANSFLGFVTKQIEPGQRDEDFRQDKIRSAPKLNLVKYYEYIDSLRLKTKLTLTEN
jgi:hypothetical protein